MNITYLISLVPFPSHLSVYVFDTWQLVSFWGSDINIYDTSFSRCPVDYIILYWFYGEIISFYFKESWIHTKSFITNQFHLSLMYENIMDVKT